VWEWKKAVPKAKKDKLVAIAQARTEKGKSTALTYKGELVDTKKLRRHVKEASRKEVILVSGNNRRDGRSDPVLSFPNKM
jgi:hypothetical protein